MKGGIIKESECFIITVTHYTTAEHFLMCVFMCLLECCRSGVEHTQEAARGSMVGGHDPFGKSHFTDYLFFFLFNKSLVSPHREKHEEFGDVKKVVTDEFVRQK